MTAREAAARTREPSSTRDAILDAAERRFAERGFAGVSVRQITADAGLRNQASLYHHFKNKRAIYEAVLEHTPADSVIAFFRSRTMTLLTDRRSFQTRNLDRILQSADFYAERRNSTFWQPRLDRNHEGLVEVWSDGRWILWEVTG